MTVMFDPMLELVSQFVFGYWKIAFDLHNEFSGFHQTLLRMVGEGEGPKAIFPGDRPMELL